MKSYLILLMLFPIIAVSQSNTSQLYDLRFNYLRDKSSISFDDLLNRFPDSIANKTKLNENETLFVLDSVLSTSYYSQSEKIIYFNQYYKYDSKGNIIESKRLTNCIACSIGMNDKRIFTFDENGNTTSEINFDLDLNSNEWVPVFKSEMVYGINGIIEEHFFRKYATVEEWEPSSKTVYTYDVNGRLVKDIRYQWNDSVSSWRYSSKMEQEFDENGNLLIRENYTYDLDNSLWIGTVKEENLFEDGLIITGIRYEWNDELNQWRNQTKDEYTYDAIGIEKMEIGFRWNATDETWENFYRYEFKIINVSGRVDKITTFKIDSSNQWIGAYREEYGYDENGNITLLINSEWNKTISDWLYEYKYESEFADNQLVSKIVYTWDKTQNDWICSSKRTFDFDINRNIKTDNIYDWDIDNNDWWLSHRSESFYSELATKVYQYLNKFQDILIYPNPASETFTIESANPGVAVCQLYNSTGKLLKTLPLENGINTYNISELKSGIYFIRIPQKETIAVKKLVKN